MIKMKVNQDRHSKCSNCGCEWKNTKEMYTILFVEKKENLCSKCFEDLFHKCLHMTCEYNSKLKTQIDLKRIQNENKMRGI